MGKKLWVEPTQGGFNQNHDGVDPRVAKISFTSKWKLPIEECDCSHSRNGALGKKRDMFFARIGGYPEEGFKWIAENLKGVKLNLSLPENMGVDGRGKTSVSFVRKGRRRHLGFARIADALDPETQKDLEEVKEGVIETAAKARVPVPSGSLPYIGFIHSLTVKNLLCGILAGAVAATLVTPFDIVRTRIVAGQGGQTAAQVVSTVAQEEGLQSLFKGSLPINLVKNGFEKGLQFMTFEFVKTYQEEHQGGQKRVLPLPRQIPLAWAGGAAGGLVGTLISYPMQPVFDRLLVQPEKYKGIRDSFMQILRNEGGIRELYRGITPALIAIVPNAAISFYTYETLKTKYLTKNSLKPEFDALRTLIIGGLAGVVSTTITYPLELARKEVLLSALPSSAVHFAGAQRNAHYSNTLQALNGIVKSQGVRGLYRGLTAQTLQIVPMTAVTFLVYELAKRAFVASGAERRDQIKDIDDLDEE
ncbi:unnamed protein product [Calypogeia fissa]